jgi:hypothetical protein
LGSFFDLGSIFYLLIKINWDQYNMIYFKSFSWNSFITLWFTSKFNPICGQLRPNKGPVIKRISEGKIKKNYLDKLTHYGCVYYSGCKFYDLILVDKVCYCIFISLPHVFFYLILCQFFVSAFKLG